MNPVKRPDTSTSYPCARTFGIALAFALTIALCASCKNRESQIAGSWHDQYGINLVFYNNKTFSQIGSDNGWAGSWQVDPDGNVIARVKTMGGRPVDDVVDEQAAAVNAKLPPGASQYSAGKVKTMMHGVRFTVSDDGKQMSRGTGPSSPLDTYKKDE